jgi:hypothetical protein
LQSQVLDIDVNFVSSGDFVHHLQDSETITKVDEKLEYLLATSSVTGRL